MSNGANDEFIEKAEESFDHITVPGIKERLSAFRRVRSVSRWPRQQHQGSLESLNTIGSDDTPPAAPPSIESPQPVVALSSAQSTQPTRNIPEKQAPKVNLCALLNDPRPGKRTVQSNAILYNLYGDAFSHKAVIPPRYDIDGHHNTNFSRTELEYKKNILSRIKRKSNFHHLQSNNFQQIENSLQKIPQLFTQNSFDLSAPNTFYNVVACLSSSSGGVDGLIRQQNRLESYKEAVEGDIVAQLSAKSDVFFAAMSSHDALQSYLSHTKRVVLHLRKQLDQVVQCDISSALGVLRNHLHRRRLNLIIQRLHLIKTVHETKNKIHSYLVEGEFAGAVDVIQCTKNILSQDLAGVVAFRHLSIELSQSEANIVSLLEIELSHALREVLSGGLEESEEQRLVPIILGYLKICNIEFVTMIERECSRFVKLSLERFLEKWFESTTSRLLSNEGGTGAHLMREEATVAQLIRSLSQKEFEAFVADSSETCRHVSSRVRHIYAIASQLVASEETEAAADNESDDDELLSPRSISSLRQIKVSDDTRSRLRVRLREMLVQVAEKLQRKLCRILESRDISTNSVSIDHVTRLYSTLRSLSSFMNENHSLASSGEAATGQNRLILDHFIRSSLIEQFVTQFADEKRAKLIEIIDADNFEIPTAVSKHYQRIADAIEKEGRMTRPPAATDLDSVNGIAEVSSESESTSTSGIIVRGERFIVTYSTLELFDTISLYVDLVERLGSALRVSSTTSGSAALGPVARRLTELLSTFNAATCTRVLGGETTGLLSDISPRQLALLFRSITFIKSYFVLFHDFFFASQTNNRSSGDNQLINGEKSPKSSIGGERALHKVLCDFNEHLEKLEKRMLDVPMRRMREALSTWRLKPPVPSPTFRSIAESMRKFINSVEPILQREQIQRLILTLNILLRKHIISTLTASLPNHTAHPQQMYLNQELAFYNSALRDVGYSHDPISIAQIMQ